MIYDICNEHDYKFITQILITARARDDSWFWIHEDKVDFSVKSCYRRLQGEKEFMNGNFLEKIMEFSIARKSYKLFMESMSRSLTYNSCIG